MYCSTCGASVPEEAKFCPQCGSPMGKRPVLQNEGRPGIQAVGQGISQTGTGFGSVSTGTRPCDAVQGVTGITPRVPGSDLAPLDQGGRGPRNGGVTLLLSFLMLGLVLVVEVACALVGRLLSVDMSVALTVGGAVGGVLGVVLLGGSSLYRSTREGIFHDLKESWWFLLVNTGLLAYVIVSSCVDGSFVVTEGWFVRVIILIVYTLAIGMHEESVFRGLILGGFLAACGGTKRGVVVAALLTTLLFSLAHVDFTTLDVSDALSVGQAVLKMLQVGIIGFYLATLVLSTGRLLGAALVHALTDFVLMLPDMALAGSISTVEYVATDSSTGMATLVFYAIMIVIYLPLLAKGVQMLRDAKAPNRGALRR